MFYIGTYYKKKFFYITEHLTTRAAERQKKISLARNRNELLECQCCYNDELLAEDMLSCDKNHFFCHECIRKSTEEVIGNDKTSFPCLSSNCNSFFSLDKIKVALYPTTFSHLLFRIQQEEVRSASIDGLHSCPFCNFASIMVDKNDKVFYCLNPECMKESCRYIISLNLSDTF